MLDDDGVEVDSIDGEVVCVSEFERVDLTDNDEDADFDDVMVGTDEPVD